MTRNVNHETLVVLETNFFHLFEIIVRLRSCHRFFFYLCPVYFGKRLRSLDSLNED